MPASKRIAASPPPPSAPPGGEAEQVRQRVAQHWQLVHAQLTSEARALAAEHKCPAKELVQSLAIASDQLRRDYRLPWEPGGAAAGGENSPAESAAADSNPLTRLRLVDSPPKGA